MAPRVWIRFGASAGEQERQAKVAATWPVMPGFTPRDAVVVTGAGSGIGAGLGGVP
jgi:hypothetical protein